jgi:hypothetical protein
MGTVDGEEIEGSAGVAEAGDDECTPNLLAR